jgi:NADPH:quinone reductase-like Zn-dependent oxidoreductase
MATRSAVSGPLPATMQALELQAYDGRPQVVERPVPKPGPGEVLIRIAASPVNPSDLMFMRGQYGVTRSLPTVPGFEASGTVVAAGPGPWPRLLVGRRVGCAASDRQDGTWAEYMVTHAMRCLPLLRSVSLEQGATMIVNPMTAWALLDIARRGKHRAIANTAAASALGRMILRLGLRYNLPVVHIVRRQEQVDLLRGLGGQHVLDSSQPDFDERLRETFRGLGVTLALDGVAGKMTQSLLAAMPRRGRVMVYGSLSGIACRADPGQLIYGRKGVEGFWLSDWVSRLTVPRLLMTSFAVQRMLAAELRTTIRARVSLQDAAPELQAYKAEMTKGKVLIIPSET